MAISCAQLQLNFSSTARGVTTTARGVTTTAPRVTTTAPGVTSTAPGVTSTAPGVTSTAPGITSTAPGVTTTAPRVTTTAPRVTTTAPGVTTNARGVTTTAHVGRDSPPIRVLLGADILGSILTGRIEVLSSGVSAVETLLDPIEKINESLLEEETLTHFKERIRICENQRYEVALPWLAGHPALYDKYDAVESRLRTATKRLINENYFEAYDNVFKQWEAEGIIEAVPIDQLAKEVHYLPHRPVIKPSSNTKGWDVVSVELSCKLPANIDCTQEKPVTKRVLLSVINSVYDPIGFTAPALLLPKLLMQEACRGKIGWDEFFWESALLSKKDIKASCAELVYGTILQLPSDMIETSIIPPCDDIFVDRLRNTTPELNPVATSAHDKTNFYVNPSLKTSSHVFLRIGSVKPPLCQSYTGPHKVLKRTQKNFTIELNGRTSTASTDRLKPAYLIPICEEKTRILHAEKTVSRANFQSNK
ncbi:hypothetical protein HNY73_023220 [Argiope bruennichi]|uniref:Uncharacterized protein n=1 Tax=Argiope bruennichi TaxID=94029 RepID=A0A8T0E7Q1_ARGBR|nr:hypothetical protein HNY73_023220 [Argiope bruennichi]